MVEPPKKVKEEKKNKESSLQIALEALQKVEGVTGLSTNNNHGIQAEAPLSNRLRQYLN